MNENKKDGRPNIFTLTKDHRNLSILTLPSTQRSTKRKLTSGTKIENLIKNVKDVDLRLDDMKVVGKEKREKSLRKMNKEEIIKSKMDQDLRQAFVCVFLI